MANEKDPSPSAARRKVNAEARKKELTAAFTTGAIGKALPLVVGLVEAIAGTRKGAEKRALALRVLNLVVNIPVINEDTEAWIFDQVIDAVLKPAKKADKVKPD
jgi:hypothetical protein